MVAKTLKPKLKLTKRRNQGASASTKGRRRKLTIQDIEILKKTAARMINQSESEVPFLEIKKLSEDPAIKKLGIGRSSIHTYLSKERIGEEKTFETLLRLIVSPFLIEVKKSLEDTIKINYPASPIERMAPIFFTLALRGQDNIQSAKVVLRHVKFSPPFGLAKEEVGSIMGLIDQVINESRNKSELAAEVLYFDDSFIRQMLVDTVINLLRDLFLKDEEPDVHRIRASQVVAMELLQILTTPEARQRLEPMISSIKDQLPTKAPSTKK